MVHDSESLDKFLATDFGLSAVVKDPQGSMLVFDTGADGDILDRSMRQLELGSQDTAAVVLSHWHWDHSGGLSTILGEALHATLVVALGQQHGFLSAHVRRPLNTRGHLVR